MKKLVTATAVLVTVALVGGIAYATIPDSSGTIHGCNSTTGGSLRVIDASLTNCKSSETSLDWSVQGRALGDTLGMTDRFLVVGEPVEQALPYDRHHDLDRVGLPDMRPENVVRMLNGADDENVPAHDRNVPTGAKVLSVEASKVSRLSLGHEDAPPRSNEMQTK